MPGHDGSRVGLEKALFGHVYLCQCVVRRVALKETCLAPQLSVPPHDGKGVLTICA